MTGVQTCALPIYDSHISQNVIDEISAGNIVNSKNIKSVNDLRLLQIGWVYDLNFFPTFKALNERGYIKLIRDVMPADKRVDKIMDDIQHYIEEILKLQKHPIDELIKI